VSGHVLVHLINIESVRGIKWLTLTLSTIFQLYHGGQLYLCSNKMTKPNKNITVEPIPKSNIKIIEKGKIKTPNILIHDCFT
jgi:hypothetical protein